MDDAAPLSADRRDVLLGAALLGGALAIGYRPGAALAADAATPELTPWLLISPDDTVTLRLPCPEFGNGAMTQQAQAVVEELACDWAKVKIEFASTNRDLVNFGVYSPVPAAAAFFGGRSTISFRTIALQQVGAQARERLKTAAAAQWSVPVTEITAADSVLTHAPTGRTLRYGEVAAKAATVSLTSQPVIKRPNQWTFLGKVPVGKVNNAEIVTGQLQYGIDVRVPGMVYAALLQSPVHGGRLKSYDAKAVMGMPGVLAVVTVDPDEARGVAAMSAAPLGYAMTAPRAAVAVIADHSWQARKALDVLPVEWEDGHGAQWKSTQQLYDHAIKALDSDDNVRIEKLTGDVSNIAKASKVVEGIYLTPWCEQAPLEPLNGTALVTAEKVEVWHPAQNSQQGHWVASDESGMSPDRVFFHQTYVGGAFGRRLESDDVRMVVAVAKRFMGRPVHLIWSREEMTRQGKYRPMVAAKLTASLDETTGLPTAIIARQAARGHYPRFADTAYFMGPIPNVRVDARELPSVHVTPGPYRGPGYNSYVFMQETFIDECAVAAGIDPLEYRLKLLANFPNPGWTKSLNAAAKGAGWGRKLPKGMGQGIAIGAWGLNGSPKAGTCVATVATVEVSKKGVIKVHQLDVAFDCGRVMNRDSVANLIEGGSMFGLNMAMNEEMTVENGRMVEGNFDTYPMLRMADCPKINVYFEGLSDTDKYAEMGEPPVAPVGPAVGNAIFSATGKRLRRTPFRTQDVSWS
ncbi:MAG: Isoquinoline 1-oxidoreductase beta subunit [Caulobacter sp.]|nr:Isoquinoline 1-oxidoreductase beta subunit [Caulobacter sp.]